MKRIALTQGKAARVDDEDYDELVAYTWRAIRHNRTWYAVRHEGKSCVYMHRQILGLGPTRRVDHRDGHGLNNQRWNLRVATARQNARNYTRKRQGCSSQFKGVYWHERAGKWCAQIRDGERQPSGALKKRHLGLFESEKQAALAYDQAARESFGAFAALNFP